MSKSLQYIDKMIQLHGGLIGDFDEHGIISGHTVAFNYIGDRLDKWIKFLFLIDFLRNFLDRSPRIFLKHPDNLFVDVIKMGRTQLQDAVPMRLGQTFHGYASMIERDILRLTDVSREMYTVNLGGTAIGSCINTSPAYLHNIVPCLSSITRYQKSAEIAKAALKSNRTVRELVLEKHLMTAAELEQVLDPYAMTEATEDMKQAM